MASDDPVAVEERKGFSETRVARLCSWIMLGVALLVSTSSFAGMRVSQESFARVFKDLGSTLPAVAVIVTHPGFAWSIPALAVVGLVKELLIRNRIVTLVLNGVHLLVVIGLWQLYLFGIFVPLTSLLNAINK